MLGEAERPIEEPCEKTGLPCCWLSDDQYDQAGELVAWDLFCSDCYRNRDWTKDEMPRPEEPVEP